MGHLRSVSTSLEPDVVERYELRRRDCLQIGTLRQEWSRAISDLEVVWDANGVPLRAWKRMTQPHATREDGYPDIRRYELRGPEVTIKRRAYDGSVTYEILRGPRPTVVITPGRGLLSAWIQRAHLREGQSVREIALDIREVVEVIRPVTLRRSQDLYREDLHRTVRVYTLYGRESVFADEHDAVIGDLGGMRPASLATMAPPPPMPLYGTPDPVHTP